MMAETDDEKVKVLARSNNGRDHDEKAKVMAEHCAMVTESIYYYFTPHSRSEETRHVHCQAKPCLPQSPEHARLAAGIGFEMQIASTQCSFRITQPYDR
jgi:hypothetical protein